MDPDLLFRICNATALAGWLMMVIAPRWSWTRMLVLSGGLVLGLCSVYLTLIVLYFGTSEGSFSSLDGVMKLFENRQAVLAGWIHYLAFDMFAGTWMLSNSHKHGISHWVIVPCLFFTFMLGPIGLILYFTIRAFTTRKFMHENS